jgi:hypothetical protein
VFRGAQGRNLRLKTPHEVKLRRDSGEKSSREEFILRSLKLNGHDPRK